MISGAASADCGILVVAATTGEFEEGFATGGGDNGGTCCCGQTREHVLLSRGLGVTQFVVAVNKLDVADPAWSERRYKEIKSSMTRFLKEVGYREKNITVVPVSGLTGVNIHRKEGKMSQDEGEGWVALRKWYKGPTLVEAMDSFNPAKREFEKSLRVIVTDVSSEGKNINIRGRVARGFVRVGEDVVVLPVGDAATIVRVERGTAAREGGSSYTFGKCLCYQNRILVSIDIIPREGYGRYSRVTELCDDNRVCDVAIRYPFVVVELFIPPMRNDFNDNFSCSRFRQRYGMQLKRNRMGEYNTPVMF
jgi:hypothetical protein